MVFFQQGKERALLHLYSDLPREKVVEHTRILVDRSSIEVRYLATLLGAPAALKTESKPAKTLTKTSPPLQAASDIKAEVEVKKGDSTVDQALDVSPLSKAKPRKGFNLSEKLPALALFFVLLFAGVILLHFARRRGFIPRQTFSKGMIQYIAQYDVGPKQKLALVEVNGEKILLGVSPQGISFLKTIDSTDPGPSEAPKEVAKNRQIGASVVRQALPAKKSLISKNADKPSFQRYLEQKDLKPNTSKGSKVQIASESRSPLTKNHSDSVNDVTKIIREKLRRISQDMS